VYTNRGGKWATFYSETARAEQLTFFRGVLEGAPASHSVRLEVREDHDTVTALREEAEWPLARTRWRSLHLPGSGALATQQPSAAGNVTFGTRSRAAAFTWAVPEDTELTGPMSARLWVQLSGCDDANLFVGIEKWRHAKYVGFEGSYGYGRDRVSAGWQRVSLRAPDPRSPSPGNRSRPAPSRGPSASRRWWRSMSRWARRRPCSARASSCG
jgi:putative CocE/NonD family hydrolase